MSQHDQNVANDTGAAVRSDINNALAALFTLSSGATAPSTTIAHMLWADTTSGTLKRRNAANTGWIVVRTLDESFVLSRSSNTILDISDTGKTIVATSTFTQTIDAAATLGDGWYCGYRNDGSGVITIDPNAAETIDGQATITLQPGEACLIYCNGSAFKTIGRRRVIDLTEDTAPDIAADSIETWDASATAHKRILLSRVVGGVLGTEQASTSGTSIDFTSVPAWAKKITIQFVGVSTSGTEDIHIQIGDSGGLETSGYLGACATMAAGATVATNFTAAFGIVGPGATSVLHGTVVLTLEDAAQFTWVASGGLALSSSAQVYLTAGSKSLSAALDRVTVKTAGTDTFDAGAINILYE